MCHKQRWASLVWRQFLFGKISIFREKIWNFQNFIWHPKTKLFLTPPRTFHSKPLVKLKQFVLCVLSARLNWKLNVHSRLVKYFKSPWTSSSGTKCIWVKSSLSKRTTTSHTSLFHKICILDSMNEYFNIFLTGRLFTVKPVFSGYRRVIRNFYRLHGDRGCF